MVCSDICGMSGDICGMSGDICGMSGDICGMSGDICGMSGDICGMSGDICGMSGDISCPLAIFSAAQDCRALLDERTCVCGWPGCGQKLSQPAALPA